MFGYIRVYKPDMKISEYETYKAIYCGLCRELGREYGPAARMTLSFDFTFLAALMMALAEDKPVYTRRKCAANPLKSCIMADLGEIQSRCCDYAVLMLWYKLEDDLKDHGTASRLPGGGTLPGGTPGPIRRQPDASRSWISSSGTTCACRLKLKPPAPPPRTLPANPPHGF